MKKLLIFTVLLLAAFSLSVRGDYVTTTHYFHVAGAVIDTAAGGGELAPDSVRILVNFNGSEIFDAWYNTGDAQCAAGEANDIIFHDQYGDIDNDQGDGCYYIRSQFYHADTDLWHKTDHYFMLGNQSVNTIQISGSSDAADSAEKTFLGTLASYSDYQSDGDTNQVTLADSSEIVNGVWAVASRTITGDTYTPDVNIASVDADAIQVGDLDAPVYLAIADTAWDEPLTGATHNVATSAGRRLRQLETGQVLLTGTINTANDSTATLGLSGNYPDGFFVHTWLVVTVGTDSVQIRSINGYTGATDSVDMAPSESWVIVPANGDEWEIIANASVNVADLHQVVLDEIWGNATRTLTDTSGLTGLTIDIPADGIGSSELATSANVEISQHVKDSIFYQIVSVGDYATTNPDSFIGRFNQDWNNISNAGGVTVDNMENDVITDGAISTAGAQFIAKEAWQNIDTTNTIDTSDVGDWFRNNVAGGAAALPDSVVSRIDSILVSLGYDATDLHTKVDNLSLSGGGSEPETLIVLATDSTQLQGVRVTVRTIDQSTEKVPGLTTDVNGKLILDLDADSFFVALSANNYIQKNDTIVVAAGGQTDTIFMTLFDPGSPSAANLCKVYGWIRQVGVGLKGVKVSAFIPDDFYPIYEDDVAILARKPPTLTDSSGYWELEVQPNINLSDTTSRWTFEAYYNGRELINREENIPDTTVYALPAE